MHIHYTYVFQKRKKYLMLEKCPHIAQCTNPGKICTMYECIFEILMGNGVALPKLSWLKGHAQTT